MKRNRPSSEEKKAAQWAAFFVSADGAGLESACFLDASRLPIEIHNSACG